MGMSIETPVSQIKKKRYMNYIAKILSSMDHDQRGSIGSMSGREREIILSRAREHLLDKFPHDQEIIDGCFEEWLARGGM